MVGEVLEDRLQVRKELRKCADVWQFLRRQLRLNVSFCVLCIQLWSQFETGDRFPMELKFQPPLISIWIVGDSKRASVFLQEDCIAIAMPLLAFSGLGVETRHQGLATAESIPQAGIPLVEGMPEYLSGADEASLFPSRVARDGPALPINMQIHSRY